MKQTILLLALLSIVYGFAQQTDALYIDPTGRVGIGTNSPATTLDVNGSLNISLGNYLQVGNGYISSADSMPYLHLSNNEWFNGSEWVQTGDGALIQLYDTQTVRFLTFTQGNQDHTEQLRIDPGQVTVDYDLEVEGSVGIGGNANIDSSLTVAGSTSLTGALTGSSLTLSAPASNQAIRINSGSFSMGEGSTFQIDSEHKSGGNFSVDQYGDVTIGGNLAVSSGSYYSLESIDSTYQVVWALGPNGRLIVGPGQNFGGLCVEGGITANCNGNSSMDIPNAFGADHSLMPLEELASYVSINQQLPGMPSSEELQENGLALGEMQLKTMEKLQELTLYVLELKKENDVLREEIEKLKADGN